MTNNRRFLVTLTILFLVTATFAFVTTYLTIPHEGSEILAKQPLASTKEFVLTTYTPYPGAPQAKLLTRIFWNVLHLRFGNPGPSLGTEFTPHAPGPNGIYGLLTTCTDLTGVFYAIDKDLAAGTVQFGHTNSLYQKEWLRVVQRMLATSEVDWWDFSGKGHQFRTEAVVFLKVNRRLVLVLPKDKASIYQLKDLATGLETLREK